MSSDFKSNPLYILSQTVKIILRISIFLLLIQQCVPLKKQFLFQDTRRKTIKELHLMDTTLVYPAYEYRLKPKDILAISLTSMTKGEYDFSALSQTGSTTVDNSTSPNRNGYMIDTGGDIRVPVLGTVKVAGLTIAEAQNLLQSLSNKYIDNVSVSVKMLNFFVYVIGECMVNGKVFAPDDRLTLVEAVALSGGFKEFADRKHVKIVRNQDNKAHIYYVNLLDEDIITKPQVYLMPNDILIVEPMRAKNMRTYTISNITLAFSTLSVFLTILLVLRNYIK